MNGPPRWGLTFPLDAIPLREQTEVVREAERMGFTDIWSFEVDGLDCFVPLAIAAQTSERLRLGTAIANVFTRGPATLAMSAATLAEMAPGRFCLGIGTGSHGVVEDWNGGRFDRPHARLRDTLTILRAALRGERVSMKLPTVSVEGFRLSRPPTAPVPIFVAALRKRMLALAGASADGVIINWLTAADVPKSVAVVREAAVRAGRDPASIEIACRIFVMADPPGPAADLYARRLISGYLNVPVYRAFQQWLGHGDELAAMHQAWDAGDRRGAVAAVPESAVRDLFLSGTPEERRAQIMAYVKAGVTLPILYLFTAETTPERQSAALLRGLRESAPA